MTPIRQLPPDYSEVRSITLTESGLLLRLNLLALLPMGAALALMIGWTAIIPSIGGADDGAPWWLNVILTLLIVLPLHELLHGVAIQITGHRPRYGIKLAQGVLYATADGAFFRWREYIFIALTPLVAITTLGMLLMPFIADGWRILIVMAVVLNAGGAIGDLWSVWMLRDFPEDTLIQDRGDSFSIYARSASGS
ncbi:MAG: hypothetical protein CUN53_07410 [Phototrophicales bacterium]|nr:MAG: hypothetical protein CUN53_07410 [Phototrophicales bacterium]